MKVFVEQTTQPNKKNVFDKKTRVLLDTVAGTLTYPYPYGYILDTKSSDGENLDCYVITDKKLAAGSIIECEPIGMVEWFEDGQADHKILAALIDEHRQVDKTIQQKIDTFAKQFIVDRPEKQYRLGEYFGREKAEALLAASNQK